MFFIEKKDDFKPFFYIKFARNYSLNPKHVLVILSQLIDCEDLEKEFAGFFTEKGGAPAKPVRLITGLFMLQNMTNFSDEGAVQQWVESPYWHFFCGYDYLQ
ncbi:MAG: transposase [Parachlamydiales bacterium]|nr:transposase [Parachlamydiales bacterium]